MNQEREREIEKERERGGEEKLMTLHKAFATDYT